MLALPLMALLPSLAMAAPSIPAGALDQVLRNYSLATGALLSADGRLTQGVSSAGLVELSTPERDLPHILAGTGLESVRQPDGSYLLRAMPVPATGARPPTELEVRDLPQLPEVKASSQPQAPNDTVSSFAVKGGAALRDIPQSLSIVESREIHEHSMFSMDSLFEQVPGVQASQGEGNRDNVVIRGYNSSADFYLNGVRDDVQYFRDFYNIDNVEVLKGPNAMALGRGGSGGAVNRISKQAEWRDIGEASLLLGSWMQRRASVDVGAAASPQLAWRLNAMTEASDTFRDGSWLRRRGVNPALAWRDDDTLLQLSYEHYRDSRVSDRGVPSYGSRPVSVDPATFFGDPANSFNSVQVDTLGARLEQRFAPSLGFTSQLHYARYDKYYQNVFAGGTEDEGRTVRMTAYGSGTRRSNLFYQADLEGSLATGTWGHRLNAGVELGRQRTDNLRTTGFFPTTGIELRSVYVPTASPQFHLPLTLRPVATDAANASTADNVAFYLQDQVTLAEQWQLLAGLRYERLDVDFRDLRNGQQLASHDRPVSPRVGVIYRPLPALSLYGSYSKGYTLRVGEQLGSLTIDNQSLTPEVVRNSEIGAKWDDGRSLSASVAIYQLRRGNVLVLDPLDADRMQLAEGQRGRGVELEVAARLSPDWKLTGGYAWQQSWVTATRSSTALAGAGMPHVPRQTLSLWSRHTLRDGLEAALGVIARGSMFSSTSNLAALPGYARLDGAVYYRVDQRHGLQVGFENLLNRRYFMSANNDNNISPGTPFAVRVGLDVGF